MKKPYYKMETYQSKTSIGYLLRRSRNLITQQLEAVFNKTEAAREITFAQWVVLMCLRDSIATTPAELSQYICYDSGALTRLLDQMEKRGLLKRKRSTKDRRMVKLQLTAKGHSTTQKLIVTVVDFYNGLLRDFTKEEVDTLLHLLSKLLGSLSRADKKGK